MIPQRIKLLRLVTFCFCLFAMGAFAYNTTSCGPSNVTDGGADASTDSGPDGGGGTTTGAEGDPCAAAKECKAGLICGAEGKCAKPECTDDAECASKGKNLTCEGGQCLGQSCQSSAQCPAGQDCNDVPGQGKRCEDIPGGTDVSSVRITTNPGAIREGATFQLKAIALNRSGAVLRSQTTFKWSSSKAGSVKVDAATGLITGGSADGEAEIVAEVGSVQSTPIKVSNFAKVAAGKVRVIVTDGKGAPIAGAKVLMQFSGGDKTATTDAKGVAAADGAAPFNMHVFHKDYAYFSVYQVGKVDLFVQLVATAKADKVGGVQGTFDFSRVQRLLGVSTDEWANYNVSFGLAGFSIPGNLIELNVDTLLGESINTKLLSNDIGLPGGVFIDAPVGKTKDGKFRAQGDPGPRILWGLGGKFKINDLLKLVPSDTSNLDVGKILAGAKPLLNNLIFGFDSTTTVEVFAKIKDVNDFNGNKKKDDLIPDYDKFPTKKIVLASKLDQKTDVKVSSYPTVKHKGKDVSLFAISLSGVLVPGYGLVPTGLTASEAKGGNTLELKSAGRRGALNTGKAVVLTLSLNIPTGDDAPPLFLSGNIQLFDKAPSSVTVDGFLGFPVDTKFDAATGKITKASLSGADLHQLDISGADNKRWIVVYKNDAEIVLPKVPAEFGTATWESASLRPVKLISGQSMDSVLEFNGLNIDRLTEVVNKFSNYTIWEKPKK